MGRPAIVPTRQSSRAASVRTQTVRSTACAPASRRRNVTRRDGRAPLLRTYGRRNGSVQLARVVVESRRVEAHAEDGERAPGDGALAAHAAVGGEREQEAVRQLLVLLQLDQRTAGRDVAQPAARDRRAARGV